MTILDEMNELTARQAARHGLPATVRNALIDLLIDWERRAQHDDSLRASARELWCWLVLSGIGEGKERYSDARR